MLPETNQQDRTLVTIPRKSWAWQVDGTGEPEEVAHLREVDTPVPEAGELLVQVARTGLNLPDLLICRGQFQRKPPYPYSPGAEFAGVVVAVAPGLEHRIGERVMCSPELDSPNGGLAEFVRVDSRIAWPIPDGVTFDEAAAISITYVTAHLALNLRARTMPGETVVVHGAAGGVGVAAVQMALLGGANVIATVGSAEKAAFCESLGAEAVVHSEVDFVDAVMDLTSGRGADVIVDPVGGWMFDKSRRALAWEGRHLVIGFAAGIPSVRANAVLLRNFSLVGVNRDEYRYRRPDVFGQMHEHVLGLCATGGLRPIVGAVFPMSRTFEAWETLEGRAAVGKLLVAPSDRM